MQPGTRLVWAIAGAGLFVVFVAVPLFMSGPTASSSATGQQDAFTLGTAVAVAGYLALPALILLGSGLLVVALLLLVAHAIERRRTGP